MRPMGIPARPAGRCSREEEEGKMVERVPRAVRWRIRRAWMADSYEVGILRLDSWEGFERMCWGEEGSRFDAARGRKGRSWRRILME